MERTVTDEESTARQWRQARWGLVGGSLLACSLVVCLNRSPHGDLVRWWTDHLHHAHAAWVFLHRGLGIYTRPFGEALVGVPFRHPTPTWPFMPGLVYPPGVLALFVPLAALGEWIPMSREAYGKLNVLAMVALAHAALWAVMLALQSTRRAGELTLLPVAWLFLARLGLAGFYDGAWLACGAMMVHALACRRPAAVLGWFAAAALLHFRAVVLVPLALVALHELLRERPVRQWPWRLLAGVALACGVCLASFALMYPVTRGYRSTQLSLWQLHAGLRFWTVVTVSLAAVVASARLADGLVAATAAVASVLALIYVPFWWHAGVALVAPLVVGAWRPGRAPAVARAVLISWFLCLQTLAWKDSPTALFIDFADFFRSSL